MNEKDFEVAFDVFLNGADIVIGEEDRINPEDVADIVIEEEDRIDREDVYLGRI